MNKKVLIGIIAGAVVFVSIVLGVIFSTPKDNVADVTTTYPPHVHVEVVDATVMNFDNITADADEDVPVFHDECEFFHRITPLSFDILTILLISAIFHLKFYPTYGQYHWNFQESLHNRRRHIQGTC